MWLWRRWWWISWYGQQVVIDTSGGWVKPSSFFYSNNNTGSCWKYRSWCICSSDIISIAEQLDFLDALLINRLAILQMWGKFWYWDCHNSFWGEKAAWEASYCKHCVDRGDERNSCPFHQEGAYSQAMEWAETGCGAKGCRPWGAGAGGRHSGSLEGFRLFMHLTLGTLLNIYMSWDILPSVCTLILQSNLLMSFRFIYNAKSIMLHLSPIYSEWRISGRKPSESSERKFKGRNCLGSY